MIISKKTIFLLCFALITISIFSGCEKKEKDEIIIDTSYQVEQLQIDGLPDEINLIREFSDIIWLSGKKEGQSCFGNFIVSNLKYKETTITLPEKETIIDFYIDENETITIITSETEIEQTQYLEKLKLYQGSKTGTVQLLSELKTCQSAYQLCMTKDFIYLIEEGLKISVFDQTGKLCGTSESNSRVEAICANGTTCYYIANDAKNNTILTGRIEQDGKITQLRKVKAQLGEDVYLIPSKEEQDEIYYKNRSSVYKIEKENAKRIITWDSFNLLGSDLLSMILLENNEFLCWNTSKNCFLKIMEKEKQSKEESNKIDEIVFASSKIQDTDRERIYRFNEEHNDCKIVIRDYSLEDNGDTQFNLDVASGNIPDIINLTSIDPIMLAEKGFFTDLSVFMEQDSEVSKENLQDDLLKLLEMDGKLYFLPPSFTIEALVGRKNDIGNRISWTLEEFDTFCKEKKAEGVTEIVANMNSAAFPAWDSRFTMEDYINLNSGNVNFLTESFQKLLSITKNYFPTKVDLSIPKNDKVKDGTAALMDVFLITFSQCAEYEWMFGKDGYSFIGYPSKDSSHSGIGMRIETYYGISNNCTRKKEAWEFLRQYFFKETLELDSVGFPIYKDSMEYQKECAMAKKEYINKKGEQIIPMLKGRYITLSNGISIKLKPLTKKQIKQIDELMNQANILDMNTSIYTTVANNIIASEVLEGFGNEKSIEEIMDIIQSRASLMISEQR